MSFVMCEEVAERELIKLLSGYFRTNKQEVVGCSRLVEDLGADSIDMVEVTMIVEQVFDITLLSEQVEGWRTVADIVSSVVGTRGINLL
ncbi:phosphopantetheine-binding protein [Pseudomonas sp. R3-41]